MKKMIFTLRDKFLSGGERSVKAKKNILAGFIIKGVNILINLAYVPLLIDFLGNEEYGIWLTLTSIISWFGFFDIGLGNGLRNNFTVAVANNNHTLARKYVSTTYAILSIIFVSLLLIFYCIAPFLNYGMIFNTTSVSHNTLLWLCLVVFSFFLIRFVFQLITVVLLADQHSAFGGLFNLLSNIICFSIILVLKYYYSSGSIVMLGTILSVSPVFVLIVASLVLYNSKYKKYAPSYKFVDFKESNKLLGLGFKFFILQIADIVIYSSTNFLITQLISPSEVIVYNISYKIFQIFPMIFAIILSPMWSATTDAFARNDKLWIKNVISKIQKISMLHILGVIILFFSASTIYKLWVGDRVDIPYDVSFFVALRTVLYLVTAVFVAFQNGIGKLKFTLYLVIVQSLLYIPFAITFVKYFDLGIVGILIAGIIVELPVKFVQYIQYKKFINGGLKGIWNK